MDDDEPPMTPRQQSLHIPSLPNLLLSPASNDDDDGGSVNNNIRPDQITTHKSTQTPTTHAPAPTPCSSSSSSSPSFYASDTEAFVQACTSHLFTVTREISTLWPRLTSGFSSHNNNTTTIYSDNNDNIDNTTTALMQTCQRLHCEAVELLKAVLRAELAASLDAPASEEAAPETTPPACAPSRDADDVPGGELGDTLAAAGGRERLRLGRQVLWLLARWNEVKRLFAVDVDEARAVGKADAADDNGRGLGYEDERHDSGAEMP